MVQLKVDIAVLEVGRIMAQSWGGSLCVWSWFTWRSCFVTPPRLQSLDEVWVHGVTLVHLRRLRSLDEDWVHGVTLVGVAVPPVS